MREGGKEERRLNGKANRRRESGRKYNIITRSRCVMYMQPIITRI